MDVDRRCSWTCKGRALSQTTPTAPPKEVTSGFKKTQDGAGHNAKLKVSKQHHRGLPLDNYILLKRDIVFTALEATQNTVSNAKPLTGYMTKL